MTKSMNPQCPTTYSFVLFDKKFVVTANPDGSIPLNSLVVVDLSKGEIQLELMNELLRRANAAPKLLKALEYLLDCSRGISGRIILEPEDEEKARKAISEALGEE